jgi:hypothetical protein
VSEWDVKIHEKCLKAKYWKSFFTSVIGSLATLTNISTWTRFWDVAYMHCAYYEVQHHRKRNEKQHEIVNYVTAVGGIMERKKNKNWNNKKEVKLFPWSE